jgi:hypothetical protein
LYSGSLIIIIITSTGLLSLFPRVVRHPPLFFNAAEQNKTEGA